MTIHDTDLVFLDTETTGIKRSEGHRVCEVALIHTRDSSEIARFSSLVDPGRDLDPKAAAVNGLSSDLLSLAPPFRDVIPAISALIEHRLVIAWKLEFDLKFLWHEYEIAGVELPAFRTFDALALARRLMPTQWPYKLGAVREALGIPCSGAHRALADAESCAAVFHQLVARTNGEIPADLIRSTY
jgi:DNA polymerase III epsilon subunit-like protein